MAKVDIKNATGRRKTSVARVFLKPGKGNIVVNGKPYEVYFGRATSQMIVRRPLEIVGAREKFDVTAMVRGGGISGQAGAVRHGIARALLDVDPEFRTKLKRVGLLTRDSRAVERKKYGKHKARRSVQYSKR